MPRAYRALQADRKDGAGMRAALKGVRPDVVLAPHGEIYESVTCGIMVVRATMATPAPKSSHPGSQSR